MKLTKDDLNFIEEILKQKNKKITFENLNYLKPTQIEYKFKKINYLLKITNRNTIKKRYSNYYLNYPEDLIFLKKEFEFFAFNKIQRMNIILEKLLRENRINIKEFEEFFGQSRSTLKKDIKYLKKILRENKLELIYKSRIGLIIEGKENDIRSFYLEYFLKNYEFFMEYFNCKKIDFLVFSLLKGKNSSFETSKILRVSLTIQSYRLKNKNLLTAIKDPFFSINIPNKYKLKYYNKFLENITYGYNSYYEKTSILNYLAGLCYIHNDLVIMKKKELFEKNLDVFLENIGKEYQIELSKDEYIKKTLGSHLKSALFKMYNNIPILNPCSIEDLVDYTELIKKIKKEIKIFEKNFKVIFNKDEILFIFFHIKSSMLRIERDNLNKKNILLVCNLGIGATQILLDQLKKHFLINIVDSISYYQFKALSLKNIDFIIHTINNFQCKIPSLKVNPLLTHKDIQNLKKNNFLPS